jgi:hypothetical protein
MSVKVFQPLTTPAGTNEQASVGQITVAGAGNSRTYGIASGAARAIFFLDVSAISGTTPSLTVFIEGLDPGSGKWQQIVVFPAQTALSAGSLAPLTADPLYYQQIRCRWTLTGTTPSATFSCGTIMLAEEGVIGA